MAFYVSPAGGPPPGHVAIVQNANSVISQGGGMGPKIMGLHAMPLMGTGIPKGGFPASAGGGGNAAIGGGALQAIAMSLLRQYGWGSQWGSFNALENREAGWNMYARNPSSGAYGLAQFINGPSEYFQYGGNPNTGLGQLTAMMNYIGQRYGSPNAAWAHETSAGWYAKGGLVQQFDQGGILRPGVTLAVNNTGRDEHVIPGYAAGGFIGGNLGQQGSSYLNAWRNRRGGGFGAAWGPVVLNQQIEAMTAAIGKATTLAGARGLTAAQHKHWAYVAGQDKKRLATLTHELGVERKWRTALTASDAQLTSWIRAAGTTPSLRRNVTSWKAQLGRQETAITRISAMLGWSKAHIAADVAAGRLGPGGKPLPGITHTYGGDVANTTGAFLAAALGPFTGTAATFDRGGWLRPGLNPPMYNATGRPELLVPARGGGGTVRLEVSSGGCNGVRPVHGVVAPQARQGQGRRRRPLSAPSAPGNDAQGFHSCR